MADHIFGFEWDQIQQIQQRAGRGRRSIDLNKPGDHGADPIGDGKFRMVPSGDIVDYDERCRRLDGRK